jgi:hypothetical protein
MKIAFSYPFDIEQVEFRRQKRQFREMIGGSQYLQSISNMEISKEITIEKNQYLKNKQEVLNKRNEKELENNIKNPLLLPKVWYDNNDHELNPILLQPKNNEKLVVESRGNAIKFANRYDASTAVSSNIEQTKTLRNIQETLTKNARDKDKMKSRVSKYFK